MKAHNFIQIRVTQFASAAAGLPSMIYRCIDCHLCVYVENRHDLYIQNYAPCVPYVPEPPPKTAWERLFDDKF